MDQPKWSNNFLEARNQFCKISVEEKILLIANYIVQHDVDLITLISYTRKNVDNVVHPKEILGKFGLAVSEKNRKSMYEIFRKYYNEINECVSKQLHTQISVDTVSDEICNTDSCMLLSTNSCR